MNKKRTLSVIALAVLIAASACIASAPWGVNAARADEAEILSTYVSDDGKKAFIAPDGIDVSILVWNQEEYDRAIDARRQKPKSDSDNSRGYEASELGDKVIDIEANPELLKLWTADPDKIPEKFDWFAGHYIMISKEYGIDAPYEGDGTDEPFKYCLVIVEGKEAEAMECIGNFERFGDGLVVRTSKFGSWRENLIIMDVIADKCLARGMDLVSWGYDQKLQTIDFDIRMKELSDADIAFFKELANETGRVIELYISENIKSVLE